MQRFSAVVITASCLLLLQGTSSPGQERGHSGGAGTSPPRPAAGRSVLAFISDTQTPTWYESIFLRRDDNEAARDELFRDILHDTTIAAVFHLGDLTEAGSRPSAWGWIDHALHALDSARLPLYLTPGNHEYMWSSEEGMAQLRARFPRLHTTHGVAGAGGIAVVLLNSNFSEMDEKAKAEQRRWYEHTLDSLDRDPRTRAIIVGTHHPPYTNSRVVSASKDVRKAFLPRFHNSRKARLFVSGHAHAVEHFREGGKDFLVTGGGGGLLQPLRTGEGQQWIDHTPFHSERRPFHWMRCRLVKDTLRITIRGRQPNRSGIAPVYRIAIPLPRS